MSGIHDSFSGSITGEVLAFNPDAIPEPDTLHIRMTRGERRIADELRKAFGGFRRVIIDVDGEQHEFSADSLIRLLEDYEGAQGMNNHIRLFGTPERAARTLVERCSSSRCPDCPICRDEYGDTCELPPKVCAWNNDEHAYDALLEWLKGGNDGE